MLFINKGNTETVKIVRQLIEKLHIDSHYSPAKVPKLNKAYDRYQNDIAV